MKKIIATIIIILIIVFSLYYFWQSGSWKRALIKDARQEMDVMEYGNSKLEENQRSLINKIIEAEAQSEGWKFISQNGFKLLKTDDSNIPFMTTVDYIFQDPQNNNVYHFLTKSYIYDMSYYGWAPLSSNLSEFNKAGPIRYRDLESWRLWQGDWEIPIFKKSNSSSTLEDVWEGKIYQENK